MKQKNKKNSTKILSVFLIIVSIIVVIFLSWEIYSRYFKNQDDPNKFVNPTEIATYNTGQNENKPDEKLPSGVVQDVGDNPINFKELKKTNEDLYAWIKIPKTKVDYPIAQSSVNMEEDFYLDKNIYKEYKFAGTIYSQKVNKKDFTDPVTILYGHNMLNGTMFNNLLKFTNVNFFNENKEIYIYTEGHIYTYLIFAATDYSNEHILYKYDFSEENQLNTFVNSIKNSSYNKNIRKDVEFKNDDKILVLSTCSNYDNDVRYLVMGVLINDEITG